MTWLTHVKISVLFYIYSNNNLILLPFSLTCEQLLIDLHPHAAALLPPLEVVAQNWGSTIVGWRCPAHCHSVLGYVRHLGLGCSAWRLWVGGFKKLTCSQMQDMKKRECV